MSNLKILLIVSIIVFVLALSPALADNSVQVLKPIKEGGAYGTGRGQIDTPISIKVGVNDSIYVLQRVHTSGSKFRTAINVYDRNLTFLRSFDVLKMSMADVNWERAQGNFYYDSLASAFDLDSNDTIYVLCGWDVVVLGSDGKYRYQFPVSAFMGWIDKTANETQFYYPHGLVVVNDSYVLITSGSTPEKHEVMYVYPDGRPIRNVNTTIKDMSSIARDRNGSLYITEPGSNVVHVYDPNMTRVKDITLYFNGTYSGDPSYLAFLSDGNMTASANGIFIYNNTSSMVAHFMDNNQSLNSVSWNRPVAVNSSDWLVVASGMQDSAKTPQPLMLYRYGEGAVTGEQGEPDYGICGGILGMFGLVSVLCFCLRRY